MPPHCMRRLKVDRTRDVDGWCCSGVDGPHRGTVRIAALELFAFLGIPHPLYHTIRMIRIRITCVPSSLKRRVLRLAVGHTLTLSVHICAHLRTSLSATLPSWPFPSHEHYSSIMLRNVARPLHSELVPSSRTYSLYTFPCSISSPEYGMAET